MTTITKRTKGATIGLVLELQASAGTFGWKLTTSAHKPLFTGSGPIDGPIEIGSSTRSELGGFTAPLLLVTILVRHWGMKHKCSFRWIADSKIALHRVSIVTRPDHSPTKQPDNVNYVSVIRDLFKELRRPINAQWIKSHQDSNTPYHTLDPDTKLNVDADELATLQHKSTKPQRHTEHIPSTRVSITISKTRYYGNFDTSIRYHINGSYLRLHLQHRNHWSDNTWNLIDMHSLGRLLKRIPLAHRPAHLKLLHDQLPLGHSKYKCATVKDKNLRLCPCCTTHEEDNTHLLTCANNPAHKDAKTALIKTILADHHPSRPALASCINQYSSAPNQLPVLHNNKFPGHLETSLKKAILEQTLVGWHHLLLGFLSKEWLQLSAAEPHCADKATLPAGQHRIQQILNAITEYTRAIWLGRNDVLHKDSDTVATTIYSTESAKLRHFHSNPHLLPRSDQHYCNLPLQRLLRSRPSVRRRWLRRVKTARTAFLKNGKLQQRITQYLDMARPPDPLPPAPKITRPGLTRVTTTQQRMTDYFPGRPPDPSSITSLPSNPSPPHP